MAAWWWILSWKYFPNVKKTKQVGIGDVLWQKFTNQGKQLRTFFRTDLAHPNHLRVYIGKSSTPDHCFPTARVLVSPKFPRVPEEGGWCRGGSRYVDGWGMPLIENEKMQRFLVSWFLVFKVSKFQSFRVSNFQSFQVSKFQRFRDSKVPFNASGKILLPYYQKSISCFLEDIGPTFTIFEKNGTDLQDCSVPAFSKNLKHLDVHFWDF